MKHLMIVFMITVCSIGLNAQKNPQDLNLNELMEDLRLMMDSLDLNNILDEDLMREWNKAMSDSLMSFRYFEDTDSIFSHRYFDEFEHNEFHFDSLFFNSDQINQMMERSLKILEDMDFSHIRKLLDKMDLDFEYLKPQLIPKDTIRSQEIPFKKI